MAPARISAPWHLWAVGIVAVLFNFVGVFDFVMSHAQGAEYLARAGMTPEQIAHYLQMPAWMTLDWALGVFGAFGASVLLLMRRRVAAPVFWVSLAAFAVSLLYTYVLTDGGKVMGPDVAVASTVIAVLLVLFSLYAQRMARRGVLR